MIEAAPVCVRLGIDDVGALLEDQLPRTIERLHVTPDLPVDVTERLYFQITRWLNRKAGVTMEGDMVVVPVTQLAPLYRLTGETNPAYSKATLLRLTPSPHGATPQEIVFDYVTQLIDTFLVYLILEGMEQ